MNPKLYGIVIETADGFNSLSGDYRAKFCTSCRLAGPDSHPVQSQDKQRLERGARQPTDIIVETYTWSQVNMASTSMLSDADFPPLSSEASGEPSKESREQTPGSSLGEARESTPSGSYASHSTGAVSKETTPSEFSTKSRSRSTKDGSPVDQDGMSFISGNPFVEITKGIIHLFKDNKCSEYDQTELMCMYGVPAKHKTQDLLQFTGPCHADIEYMKIIHDGTPNQYMVILKFRSSESAKEFYAAYNGLPYNSIEPEVCSVLPIAWIEHCQESEYYPVGDTGTELPYCSICLERMDESVSTVITILCNHRFHCGCLSQWEDPTCPVCRHVQTPEVVTEQYCSDCQSYSDLWICLVCGYIGCGRYAGGHAHKHFSETQHCYSMELGHNRVWDYVGDNFVHRLVQNTSDGKLVEQEVGGMDGKRRNVGGLHVDTDEKMDSLQLEYTYLLTSQLESQRAYYESKLSRVEDEATREVNELTVRLKSSQEEKNKLESNLENFSREKVKTDAKIAQLTAKVSKLTSQLEEEKQLNSSLRQNQEDWQTRLKRTEIELNVMKTQKDGEIKELQEQVRDLMFYLEAQVKVQDSPLREEIQEGNIVVGAAEAASGSSKQQKQKGNRKRKS